MNRRKETDQFHDSEAGDVFDLYNACNGVMLGDLLDVRKLDELSADEAEALDATWLREVWKHTASGCAKCENIIQTLHCTRAALREESKDLAADEISQ